MTHQPHAQEEFSPNPTDVIVGIDGSDTSTTALTWAIREAQLRGGRLRLITAYGIPLLADTSLAAAAYREVLGSFRDVAVTTAADARSKVLDQGVEVSDATVEGDAAGALIKASETAGLLVVGSRGLGGFAGRMLGSVSSALPGHAHCPVVVIPSAEVKGKHRHRGRDGAPTLTGVVAGVDGSAQAAAAALVAADYAQRHGLGLTVMWARPAETSHIPWRLTEAEVAEYQSWTDHEATWLKGHFPTLDITASFHQQSPVEALSEASATADLVVVGTRGHGGFTGLLLGSTSQSLVHHGRGPVMIVPYDKKKVDPRLESRRHPATTPGDRR